jgi:hypothetical protein
MIDVLIMSSAQGEGAWPCWGTTADCGGAAIAYRGNRGPRPSRTAALT